MLEVLVQSYLRSGKSLEDLRLEHGVKSFVQNGKISLSYDQIEAKESDTLSQQCRGLILRESSYDLVSVPMFRFFNLEQIEIAAELDWTSSVYEEKLDGTMSGIYYDKIADSWHVSTRSRPEADVPMDGETLTFANLFDMAVKKKFGSSYDLNKLMGSSPVDLKNKTICFELCSPYNRIVCEYLTPQITLLAVRDLTSLEEEDPKIYAAYLNVDTVKTYSASNIESMIKIINEWDPKDHEGIVVKDKDYRRLKVKSPAYVALNHMRDSLSTSVRGCVEVILLGKDDDIISMMPEFIADRVKKFKPLIAKVFKQTERDYNEIKHIDNMKEFAFESNKKLWPAALFALKRNKTPDLISFAKGKKETPNGGISQGSLDSIIDLCSKIESMENSCQIS